MKYTLLVLPSVTKAMRHIPAQLRKNIDDHISALADNPRPPQHVKLTGSEQYRVRVGSYRIIYVIDDQQREVTVRLVAHRREVYRRK